MKQIKYYLAPMEGLGDRPFRKAIAQIGGFDEATTEFIRVPKSAHIKSLARVYDPLETAPIPLAAQVMGSDPLLMAEMAAELERRGAPRIELNCGCPSNTVTGRGAGSTLLKDPRQLCTIATAMRQTIRVPFTIKIRSGYDDTSLFDEILAAAEESGASHLTLHPRTKREGYGPPADWSLIARAKVRLKIPVIGSGDVKAPKDIFRMVEETGCDGVMIGRGAVANPWIFREARDPIGRDYARFLTTYHQNLQEAPLKTQLNKLKQLSRYLLEDRELLRHGPTDPEGYLQALLTQLLNKGG
ncbi:MAG: tRNA-dihydrouridine synthase family protein [Parachlamydiales bacterium]